MCNRYRMPDSLFVILGLHRPRGDGYWQDAQAYHQEQITLCVDTAADMVNVLTPNYHEEAIGVCFAAVPADIRAAISFTAETGGKLPLGDMLQTAIEVVDDAPSGYAAYDMINCAHPAHFESVCTGAAARPERLHGICGNASAKSHVKLDESGTLE